MTREIKTIKAYETWAVYRPDGRPINISVTPATREQAITEAVVMIGYPWEALEVNGYRCVKVKITQVETTP